MQSSSTHSQDLCSQKGKATPELTINQALVVCLSAFVHSQRAPSKAREKATREFQEMLVLLLADHQAN